MFLNRNKKKKKKIYPCNFHFSLFKVQFYRAFITGTRKHDETNLLPSLSWFEMSNVRSAYGTSAALYVCVWGRGVLG